MSLARNTLINIISASLPVVLALITVPATIALIGAGRYGVLTIAWIFAGYFGLFELGLGRATTHRIAALPRESSRQAYADVVWTALLANLALGTAGGLLLGWAAWEFMGLIFWGEAALVAEIKPAIPLLALCVPLTMATGVFSGALVGRQRFASAAIVLQCATSLSLLLPMLAAAFWSEQLGSLIAATAVARLIGLAAALALVWGDILKGSTIRFDRSQWRSLLSFGGWIALSAIVAPLILSSDRMLLGASFGAAAVTAYAVPHQVATRLLVLSDALANALFPRIAAQDDTEQAVHLAKQAQLTTALLMALPIAALIPLVEPLLQLWLQGAFDLRSVAVGQIALIGVWINSIAAAPFAHIQARGNPRFTGLLHLAEILPYLALLYLLGQAFGLAGMCAAFALRCLVDMLALSARAFGWRAFPWMPFLAILILLIAETMIAQYYTAIWPLILLSGAAMLASLAFAHRTIPQIARTAISSMIPIMSSRP